MDQCSTIAFKAGDVVQTQVSFIAFQKGRAIKGKKTFGVHTVLRSVALLDSSVRVVSSMSPKSNKQ